MPDEQKQSEEIPGITSPTPSEPIVPVFPPEWKPIFDQLRQAGWVFGADVFLVLCGHSFSEEFISTTVEVEASDSIGLSYFIDQALAKAAKQFDEDVEQLRAKYICFKGSEFDEDCVLELKPGEIHIEFEDSVWMPWEKAKVTKKIRLGFPTHRENFFVRVRAKASVRITCIHKREDGE